MVAKNVVANKQGNHVSNRGLSYNDHLQTSEKAMLEHLETADMMASFSIEGEFKLDNTPSAHVTLSTLELVLLAGDLDTIALFLEKAPPLKDVFLENLHYLSLHDMVSANSRFLGDINYSLQKFGRHPPSLFDDAPMDVLLALMYRDINPYLWFMEEGGLGKIDRVLDGVLAHDIAFGKHHVEALRRLSSESYFTWASSVIPHLPNEIVDEDFFKTHEFKAQYEYSSFFDEKVPYHRDDLRNALKRQKITQDRKNLKENIPLNAKQKKSVPKQAKI